MKTVLALAAVLGLSVSAAWAGCPGHDDATASVDKETTVASIGSTVSTDAVKKEKEAK